MRHPYKKDKTALAADPSVFSALPTVESKVWLTVPIAEITGSPPPVWSGGCGHIS
jgi:hypothetical protein